MIGLRPITFRAIASNRSHASGVNPAPTTLGSLLMPDPIKTKANISGPLTDCHFSLLGRVLAAWSMVELRLAFTVALVSGAKVRSILFAFQNMTIRAKLDTAGSVVSAERIQGYEEMRAVFLPLLDEARKLSGVRHAAAHSVCLVSQPEAAWSPSISNPGGSARKSDG